MQPTLVIRECNTVGVCVDVQLNGVHFAAQSRFQSILIGHTRAFGRVLVLDNVAQSYEADESVYHAALVHPAMFSHRNPQRVLIAGGGEGATLREVLKHPSVKQVVMCDIDDMLVEACREHLSSWHQGAFEDQRVQLVHEDIRSWVKARRGQVFDVVIHDLGDPHAAGPARRAFTVEFFNELHDCLADESVVAVQAGEFAHGAEVAYPRLLRTLSHAFDKALPYRQYVHSFAAEWGFVLAGPATLGTTPTDLQQRHRAAKGEGWLDYSPELHQAMMTLSPRQRERLSRPAAPLSDADRDESAD